MPRAALGADSRWRLVVAAQQHRDIHAEQRIGGDPDSGGPECGGNPRRRSRVAPPCQCLGHADRIAGAAEIHHVESRLPQHPSRRAGKSATTGAVQHLHDDALGSGERGGLTMGGALGTSEHSPAHAPDGQEPEQA